MMLNSNNKAAFKFLSMKFRPKFCVGGSPGKKAEFYPVQTPRRKETLPWGAHAWHVLLAAAPRWGTKGCSCTPGNKRFPGKQGDQPRPLPLSTGNTMDLGPLFEKIPTLAAYHQASPTHHAGSIPNAAVV